MGYAEGMIINQKANQKIRASECALASGEIISLVNMGYKWNADRSDRNALQWKNLNVIHGQLG